MVWIFPALHWTFGVLLIPKMSQLFPLAIYCEDKLCNCCKTYNLLWYGKWHSFLHLRRVNLMCSWPIFVYGEHLWGTVFFFFLFLVVWCTNTALGRASAGLEHCVPHGYSPVYSEVHAEETSTWLAVNGYACYWLFSRSRWITCLR